MHSGEQQWQRLISQYLHNNITKEELELLLQKAKEGEDMAALSAALKSCWEEAKNTPAADDRDWDGKFQDMLLEASSIAPFSAHRRTGRVRMLNRFMVAAGMALAIGVAAWVVWQRPVQQQQAQTAAAAHQPADLPPGTNGAVLTLANGQQILLDSTRAGVLSVQGGVTVVNANGHLAYNEQRSGDAPPVYNTITTPRGRQYQVALADGSRIWLNAGSSLRYPTSFTGTRRTVEITGEAYFEVAHLAGKPFVVTTRGMAVEVLGTHFNINAYEDEAAIQTTLVQGSVRVTAGNQARLLLPGQQSIVSGENRIRVQEANTDVVTAWKNGYFSFDQTDLHAVMRQLSRWYDVDILYEGHVPDRRFGGEIPRNANASDVLKILEESKIHFRIEDKKIIVLP